LDRIYILFLYSIKVPPILIGLAKHPVIDNYDLTSLSMIISAAAPLSKDTESETKERIGVEIKQAWGMTELSPLGTIIVS
jgi:4-coumarate--CoA ligase